MSVLLLEINQMEIIIRRFILTRRMGVIKMTIHLRISIRGMGEIGQEAQVVNVSPGGRIFDRSRIRDSDAESKMKRFKTNIETRMVECEVVKGQAEKLLKLTI